MGTGPQHPAILNRVFAGTRPDDNSRLPPDDLDPVAARRLAAGPPDAAELASRTAFCTSSRTKLKCFYH
jgi:hypothetical protein